MAEEVNEVNGPQGGVGVLHEAGGSRERGALQRTLTTAQARKLFNEILERAGDEPLESFSTSGWLKEWLSMKSSSRTSGTSARV